MQNKKLKCLKCRHIWKTRKNRFPKVCPICKNPNWNKKSMKEVIGLILGKNL